MVDFTSALYLGLAHPHGALQPWDSLTLGAPAALRAPRGEAEVEEAVAALTGAGGALLWPSTLHLFWDVFSVLARRRSTVMIDAGAYPIGRWGAAAAALRGARIARFGHHDPEGLSAALARAEGLPIVLVDGFCPACGQAAPLADYASSVEGRGGFLIVDDTQALGVLGRRPTVSSPYGTGGGGTLARQGVRGEWVLCAASLAKGFGAPLAALAGPRLIVERIRLSAPTRVHSSPPSAAAFAAAARALAINEIEGDARRTRLAENVRALRAALFRAGFVPGGGIFPVQRVAGAGEAETEILHRALERRDVRAVLMRGQCAARLEIAFAVTAAHTTEDARRLGDALADIERRSHVDDGRWSCVAGAGVPAA